MWMSNAFNPLQRDEGHMHRLRCLCTQHKGGGASYKVWPQLWRVNFATIVKGQFGPTCEGSIWPQLWRVNLATIVKGQVGWWEAFSSYVHESVLGSLLNEAIETYSEVIKTKIVVYWALNFWNLIWNFLITAPFLETKAPSQHQTNWSIKSRNWKRA